MSSAEATWVMPRARSTRLVRRSRGGHDPDHRDAIRLDALDHLGVEARQAGRDQGHLGLPAGRRREQVGDVDAATHDVQRPADQPRSGPPARAPPRPSRRVRRPDISATQPQQHDRPAGQSIEHPLTLSCVRQCRRRRIDPRSPWRSLSTDTATTAHLIEYPAGIASAVGVARSRPHLDPIARPRLLGNPAAGTSKGSSQRTARPVHRVTASTGSSSPDPDVTSDRPRQPAARHPPTDSARCGRVIVEVHTHHGHRAGVQALPARRSAVTCQTSTVASAAASSRAPTRPTPPQQRPRSRTGRSRHAIACRRAADWRDGLGGVGRRRSGEVVGRKRHHVHFALKGRHCAKVCPQRCIHSGRCISLRIYRRVVPHSAP